VFRTCWYRMPINFAMSPVFMPFEARYRILALLVANSVSRVSGLYPTRTWFWTSTGVSTFLFSTLTAIVPCPFLGTNEEKSNLVVVLFFFMSLL